MFARSVSVESVLSVFMLLACIISLVEGILYIMHKNKEDKKMFILSLAFVAIILLMKIVLEYVVYSKVLEDKSELIMAGVCLITAVLLYKKRDA